MSFALGTFSIADAPAFVGVVVGDAVTPLAALCSLTTPCELAPEDIRSMLGLLARWDSAVREIERIVHLNRSKQALRRYPIDSLQVHPPVVLPRQIFCTGANYRKHVVDLTIDMGVGPEGLSGAALRTWAEKMMDERAAHGEPYVFTKLPSAITGAFDHIRLPGLATKPDWELELGVIIGRAGLHIPRARAAEHIAGYAIVNDVTSRDLIARTDYKMLGTDWLRAKCSPTYLPFGPYMVPSKFVADPGNLRLMLKLNGEVMQDESTADMMFDVHRQIEYISSHAQLWPGDLICTGSPAGNGTHYGRFLRDGDLVEASISGLGHQRNVCVSA